MSGILTAKRTATLAAIILAIISSLELYSLNDRTDFCTFTQSVCLFPKIITGLITVHMSIGVLVFKPLCVILPCVLFDYALTVLQGVAIAFAGYVLYKIAKEFLKDEKAAYLIMITFYLAPGVHGLVTFDVHVESFALPLVALMIYYAVAKDEPEKGYLFGIAALTFKETMVLPIAGVFLWRLVHKKSKKWEMILPIIGGLAVYLYLFKFLSTVGMKGGLFKSRIAHSLGEIIGPQKLLFFASAIATFPLLGLSIITKNIVLLLPDFMNYFLTAEKWYLKSKFDYGYQYHGVPTLEALVVIAMTLPYFIRRERYATALKAQLLTTFVAFLFLSPLSPIPIVSILSNFYGVPLLSSLNPYPIMELSTYRPPLPIATQCFWSSMKLLSVVHDTVPRYSLIVVSDPIAPFFSCDYRLAKLGMQVFPTWDQMGKWTPARAFRFLWHWTLNEGRLRAKAMIVEYGLENTIDFPKFVMSNLTDMKIGVRNAGVIYFLSLNQSKAKEIMNMYLNREWGAIAYSGNERVLIPSLYVNLNDYGTHNEAIIKAKLYVDADGSYSFYVSPNVQSLEIDGKVFKPTNKKVLMRDRMYGHYVTTIKLSKGWHTIAVKSEPGFLAVYWKTPYSCAPYPIFGTRLKPG